MIAHRISFYCKVIKVKMLANKKSSFDYKSKLLSYIINIDVNGYFVAVSSASLIVTLTRSRVA